MNYSNAMYLANAGVVAIWLVPALLVFVGPALVKWLWNLTCPDLFSLPQLTYWQAFRVLLLALLLFGLPRLL